MNDIEYGTCDMCGREANLQRKYYHFNIKCECHLPTHSEMIKYCLDCVPLRPAETTIEIFDPIDEKIKKITIDTEILKLITDEIEHFNATHFPYKLELIDNRLVLFELMLDNLEGDVNLEDAPKEKYLLLKVILLKKCGKHL